MHAAPTTNLAQMFTLSPAPPRPSLTHPRPPPTHPWPPLIHPRPPPSHPMPPLSPPTSSSSRRQHCCQHSSPCRAPRRRTQQPLQQQRYISGAAPDVVLVQHHMLSNLKLENTCWTQKRRKQACLVHSCIRRRVLVTCHEIWPAADHCQGKDELSCRL